MFGEACLFIDASRREGNSARAPVGRIGRDAHEAGALELSNLSSYLRRMDVLRGGDLRGTNTRSGSDDLQET